LEKWWLEKVYLEPRYPIYPLVNMGGPSPYDYRGMTQSHVAALYAHLILKYWTMVREETVREEIAQNFNIFRSQSQKIAGHLGACFKCIHSLTALAFHNENAINSCTISKLVTLSFLI
jgi:hypothetical protein